MATLYITEYRRLAVEQRGGSAGCGEEPGADQTVAIGGAAAQSAAFNTGTRFVRLHADAVCSVAFGSNPVATTANKRLAAGVTEYFGIAPGLATRLSVISNT